MESKNTVGSASQKATLCDARPATKVQLTLILDTGNT